MLQKRTSLSGEKIKGSTAVRIQRAHDTNHVCVLYGEDTLYFLEHIQSNTRVRPAAQLTKTKIWVLLFLIDCAETCFHSSSPEFFKLLLFQITAGSNAATMSPMLSLCATKPPTKCKGTTRECFWLFSLGMLY